MARALIGGTRPPSMRHSTKPYSSVPSTYLDGDGHEWPALVADVPLFPTGPHVVIVRQVDIKHELPLEWDESS